MTERLPDRWHTRDFPVLLQAAERIERGDTPDADAIAAELGTADSEVTRALTALRQAGYLGKLDPADAPARRMGDGPGRDTYLTERGRRAVGIWPSGEAADALIDALRQAEELADDPDDKSALRKAAGQLASVSRNVVADLTTAYIRSQTGI